MQDRKRSLVFISYRRRDSSTVSRWLGETMQAAFGSSCVFIDTEAIRIGDDWPERINNALQSTSVLIAVIGSSWLRLTDEYGRRQLDKDDDWVRSEILHALNNKLLLIPLLVSGASLPVKEALPDCLTPMLNYQAFELRDDHWERDRNALLERLEQEGFRRTSSQLPTVNADEIRRREALIFDQQLEILKTALSLVYRAKNIARNLKEANSFETQTLLQSVQELRSCHDAYRELLFKERIFFPDNLFDILHELKHFLSGIELNTKFLHKHPEHEGRDECLRSMEGYYRELDRGYASLVDAVQAHIGIKSTSA